MELDQLNNIKKDVIDNLRVQGWTIDQIATTSPQRLATLPGIGLITAKKLIVEAQRVVNEALLVESSKEPPPPPPRYRPEVVQQSVRIRRIYET